MFAEEIVDLRTVTEVFQGEEFTEVTGRVVLHAIPSAATVALCGRDAASFTAIARPWDDSYLTHLPRCGGCAVALAGGSGAGQAFEFGVGDDPPPGSPAVDVDVRPSHGSEHESAGAEALRAVIAEHDLRRWMFTDLVMVDETIRGGFSHPLTINPGVLLPRPERALTTFLHEQIHWHSRLALTPPPRR